MSESSIKTWGLQADFLSFRDFCQSGGVASYSINQQGEREQTQVKVVVTFSGVSLLFSLW